MLFKGIRQARNRELLMFHIQEMSSLEWDRDSWEKEVRFERVLTTNYELISHASRALAVLRKLEEMRDAVLPGAAEKYRQYFLATINLPAIPHSARLSTPHEEIGRLYRVYQDYREQYARTIPGEAPC